MKTRMQPIDHIWSKLPRVVRDLGVQLKNVQVRAGDGGPRDRARQDPARGRQGPVDAPRPQRGRPRHRGPRRARSAAGKPAEGVLTLRARSTRAARSWSRSPTTAPASTPSKLGGKAVERGLVTADQLRPDEPGRHPAADLPARASRRRQRSPTSPAAVSAWTSSRPTSRPSAAPSRSSPRSAAARSAGCASR